MSQSSTNAGRPLGCGIFLSHSSQDAAIATAIAARLDAWGFQSLFLDFDPERGIPAGRDWEREIYRHIGTSGALVVVSSRNWLASRWCFAEFCSGTAEDH